MLGRRLLPLAVALALVTAACGSTTSTTPTAPPGSTSVPTAPGPADTSPAPSGSSSTAASTAPTTDSPAPTPAGSAAPSSAPSVPTSGDAGTAACAGSAENRDFFAAAAQSFSWDVYCAVLPGGWFVDTGSFRLADGGTLVISYKGPGGTRIELQEGAWCTTGGSACSPRDHELGPAPFGDRSGMLVTLGPSESDGYAIYVDPGAAPSWAITGTGMDQASFETIAAALHRVPR